MLEWLRELLGFNATGVSIETHLENKAGPVGYFLLLKQRNKRPIS